MCRHTARRSPPKCRRCGIIASLHATCGKSQLWHFYSHDQQHVRPFETTRLLQSIRWGLFTLRKSDCRSARIKGLKQRDSTMGHDRYFDGVIGRSVIHSTTCWDNSIPYCGICICGHLIKWFGAGTNRFRWQRWHRNDPRWQSQTGRERPPKIGPTRVRDRKSVV